MGPAIEGSSAATLTAGLAQQVRHGLPVADCTPRGAAGEELELLELRGDLLEEPRLQHRLAPLVDPAAERHARRREKEAAHVERRAERVEAVGVVGCGQLGDGALRLLRDHQRAVQPVPVVARQLRRAVGVQTREQGEPARPVGGRLERRELLPDLLSERRVRLGRLRTALHEPAQVHGRAAAEHRGATTIEHIPNRPQRVAVELAGSVLVLRVAQVHEVMLHPPHLALRRLIRTDLESAIDLDRVHRNQLSWQQLAQLER